MTLGSRASEVTLDQNGQGQTDYEGDSGGACFLPSIHQVVTVHSSQSSPEGFVPQTTNDVGVDAIYAWAESIIETDGPCTPKTHGAACIVVPPSDVPLSHYCGADVNQPDGGGGSYNCGTCAKGHASVEGLCSLSY
jgi:hypothetical protein